MVRKTIVFLLVCLISLIVSGCDLPSRPDDSTEEPDFVSLSFNTNGGEEIAPLLDIVFGDSVTLPIPTRENYVFIGWFLYAQDVEIVIDDNTWILGDWTLHAHWKLKSYDVVFIDYDDKILDYQTVEHGDDATAPDAPTREGYTFIGWSEDYTDITGAMTICAEYDINTYTITFDSNGGDAVSPIPEIPHGSTVSLPEPTRDDYIFLGWFVSNDVRDDNFTNNRAVTSNMTLYAQWSAIDMGVYHEVTFVDYDEAVLSMYLVPQGYSAVPPSEPQREGHDFIGWDTAFIEVTSDLEIRAVYDIHTFTVSFDTQGGELLDAIEDVPYESSIILPEPEKEDHDFIRWLLDGTLFTGTDIVTENITLTAEWTWKEHTITFGTAGGDTIDSQTVIIYTTVESLPEAARTDYVFDGWYLDGALIEAPFVYDYQEDITLTALWIGLSENITYEVFAGEATILSYEGDETELILADTIDGYPLTAIGEEAFMDNDTLEKIVLGQFVTTIGHSAFRNMSALIEIEFANATQMFGTQVLYESDALETITLSSEASHELRYYFGNNINFIPVSLTTIVFADGATHINTPLINNNLRNATTLVLASDWEHIAVNQFRDNAYVTEVILPEGLLTVGNEAFRNSAITQIHIPVSVTSIGWSAFAHTNLLATVTFAEGSQLESLEAYAFSYAGALTEITIPASVTTLGSGAFRYTASLTTVVFEEGIQLSTIGDNAFQQSALTSVHIPASVVIIGSAAFDGTSSLTTVTLEEGSQLQSIGAYAFRGSALTSFFISEAVTSVGYFAFANASVIIFTEHETQPSGWHASWNPSNVTVIWGYLETVDDGEILYAILSNDTISVLGLSPSAGSIELVIPAYIGGNEVIQIIRGAFMDEERLSGIVIPNSITAIEPDTFKNTTNLTTVTFEAYSQLEIIETWAFQNSAVESIYIPGNVITIEYEAFAGAALNSIYIPLSVLHIQLGAIMGSGELIIYTEHESEPDGWQSSGWTSWNPHDRPVVWNYTGE